VRTEGIVLQTLAKETDTRSWEVGDSGCFRIMAHCGRPERAINAQQAHLIRAIKYAEPGHLQKVERDHRRIIKAMEGKNRESLVEIVRNHLPDSRDAYLRAYGLRHGTRLPQGPLNQ
jgi:hypothetical protein